MNAHYLNQARATGPRATPHRGTRGPVARAALLLMGVALCAGHLGAQTVYRSVGADGRVTYSDRPPLQPQAQVQPLGPSAPKTEPQTSLPFALQQVVNRYPVTLYTGKNCTPCDAGRSLLAARGVPFQEKTVVTPEDVAAFGRLNPDNTLPFLTIGGQRIQGLADREWQSYLDAAGYPAASALPPGYRPAAAQPLVPLKPAAEKPTEAAAPAPPAPQPTPPNRASSNPAGIRF